MFFKRRSRANSNSYIESDSPPSRNVSKSYDRDRDRDHDADGRPDSSHLASHDPPAVNSRDMHPRSQAPQEPYGLPRGMPNGTGHSALPIDNAPVANAPLGSNSAEPMPDLLQRAFNEAVRPYTDKIGQLEAQVADLRAWAEQLEQERVEVHNWIDKRGLRPGE